MAAPDFVPTDPTQKVRKYTSPPRRPGIWAPERAGELPLGQPVGDLFGSQGPDQGYAFRLVHQFDDRLQLGNVDYDDAVAACVAVAMKRAALFGRAPVVHDLTVAFTIFGFLDDSPAPELVALREEMFPEVHNNHHYIERREIVDLARDEALLRPHNATVTMYGTNWRNNLNV